MTVFARATPILRVADFDAAVEYYSSALGFTLAWRDGNFGCVSRGDTTIMLSQGSQGCSGTWVYVSVSDADAYYRELLEHGARIRHEPRNFPWGAREVHAFDVDGNVLRFGSGAVADQPLGPWLDEAGIEWHAHSDGSWSRVQ